MYAHLKGKLIEKKPTYVVIECNGIGFHINISLFTYGNLKDEESCRLFTHLIVREDAHTLYGFNSEKERDIFKHLISVSGVGANTARMMLSYMSPDELTQAIIQNDVNTLKSIKGIGAKSAQRLIIELADKLSKGAISGGISILPHNTNKEEALSALLMLGITKQVGEKILDKVVKSNTDDMSVEDLVKKALQNM